MYTYSNRIKERLEEEKKNGKNSIKVNIIMKLSRDDRSEALLYFILLAREPFSHELFYQRTYFAEYIKLYLHYARSYQLYTRSVDCKWLISLDTVFSQNGHFSSPAICFHTYRNSSVFFCRTKYLPVFYYIGLRSYREDDTYI